MFGYNPAPKPQFKRHKLTAKQRGEVTAKVRKELHERSGGFCERCGGRAAHAAHVTRRWKLQKTTVNDLLHLCIKCHQWADNTSAGRKWLESMEKKHA